MSRININQKYDTRKSKKQMIINQLETIKIILESGIDPNIISNNGKSAMDLAIQNDYFKSCEIINLLKKYNAKTNILHNYRFEPLETFRADPTYLLLN